MIARRLLLAPKEMGRLVVSGSACPVADGNEPGLRAA